MGSDGMTPTPTIGHNGAPAYLDVFQTIDDLYQTAKDFADGEPIADEAMHDTISSLRDQIHEAGKKADELRVEEKRPFDDGAKAVQAKYKPVLTKVDKAKAALGDLLAAWRKRVADEKAAAAAAARAEADRIAQEAQAAIRASSGNLEAREQAEALLDEAKAVERAAKRADKAATTGLGLRSAWRAELVDEAAALDWAYGRAPEAFKELVQGMADGVVRAGVRAVPGFRVFDEKVV